MWDQLVAIMQGYGLSGLIILGLFAALFKLYTDKQAVHRAADAVRDARVAEAREMTGVINRNTEAFENVTRAVEAQGRTLAAVESSNRLLANMIGTGMKR